MTRSWVSGTKDTDTGTLEAELKILQAKRDELLEQNKGKFFKWSSLVMRHLGDPDIGKINSDPMTKEINDVLDAVDGLDRQIAEKQAEIDRKAEEQVRADLLS